MRARLLSIAAVCLWVHCGGGSGGSPPAASPDAAHCGTDKQCDLVGTGLGSFQCAVQ